jgi:hypothetical protein
LKNTTRIYNRFEYWSLDDCSCVHCLFYAGARLGCRLESCCCDDIRREALRRERAANTDSAAREDAMICRA